MSRGSIERGGTGLRRLTLQVVMMAVPMALVFSLSPVRALWVTPQVAFAPGAGTPIAKAGEAQRPELLVVFLGAAACDLSSAGNVTPALHQAMKSAARAARAIDGVVVSVGVSLDKDPVVGFAYLQGIAAFDELVLGRGWQNSIALDLVQRSFGSPMLTPQILVFERNPVAGSAVPTLEVRQWVFGLSEIHAWADRGAPIGASRATPREGSK